MEAFALQFGHGLGVALPRTFLSISRLVSLSNPYEIKAGMVFAAGDLLSRDLKGGQPPASKRKL